ncbi:MAG: HEAT repeat domain-containing protein [Cyanobacteriota/Melainabacteria group bacterium]
MKIPSRLNRKTKVLLAALAFSLLPLPGYAWEYAGLEFFGSSQLTKDEIDKMLHLGRGSSIEKMEKAKERLEQKIEKLKLFANIQIVTADSDRAYVSVDLIEVGDDMIPTRKLPNPHHVTTRSEKPELLLARLNARLDELTATGRDWKTIYKGGIKLYSDEPANQLVEEIRRFAPTMKPDWLAVVSNDPDPERRIQAIELLNWSGDSVDTCYRLIGAIDDSNYRVRGAATRFIFDRLDLLPHDFPFEDLMHALCRQIGRPSHEDRVKSAYLMFAILNRKPLLTGMASECAGKQVDIYAEKSVIPTLRSIAERLKTKFSQPTPVKRTNLAPPPSSGF